MKQNEASHNKNVNPPTQTFQRFTQRGATALTTNIALAILGSLLLFFSRHLGSEFYHFTIGYSETTLCALITFFGAALLVATQPTDRFTLPLILVVAGLCRLSLLTPYPHLSSDIYRYVWDGIMQHHGINPYRYVPGDTALRAFRDQDIFPYINRRDYAPTIYPPVAQMFFYLATFLTHDLTGMRLAMYASEAVTIASLALMLPRFGLRRELVLLYAWSPLLIWEVGSSGHLDALMTAFIALALLARLYNKPWLTGFALGAAVFTKFYPLILFPALWKRRDWRMPLATALMALTYVPYLSVGKKVLGFAGGYADEEGINTGSRFFLFEFAQRNLHTHLPNAAYFAFCALCFAPILIWCWRINNQPEQGTDTRFVAPAATLFFALMLMFSPRYPWYVIGLTPFAVLIPTLPIGVYLTAIFYAFTTQWASPGEGMYFLNKWIYGSTAIAFLLHFLYKRTTQQLETNN